MQEADRRVLQNLRVGGLINDIDFYVLTETKAKQPTYHFLCVVRIVCDRVQDSWLSLTVKGQNAICTSA